MFTGQKAMRKGERGRTRLHIRRQLERFKLRALVTNRACTGLRLDELERLAAMVELGGASAGTVLVEEGSSQEEFLMLWRGVVEVSRGGCLVGYLREGDYFGSPRPAAAGLSPVTVTAVTAVTVLIAAGANYRPAIEITGATIAPAPLLRAKASA